MTISAERVRERLAVHYKDIQQIEDTVLRFTRRSSDRPFAVYYIDVASELPSTLAALDQYQDRIVGKFFFEGSKSLQWSTYLFFLIEPDRIKSDDLRRSKELIERDRKYARKFVIPEPELEAAIAPPPIKPAGEQAIDLNVMSEWTNILAVANLDRAILNDEPMTKRLEMIEANFGQDLEVLPAASSTRQPRKQPFLKAITLSAFREFPVCREFTFSTVNLICGPNGAGKTSLLEAIELVYCGHHHRNPKSDEKYTIAVTYADYTTESATDKRQTSLLRDRNLQWYGQYDARSSTLHQSFARFNFLNTDAAVSLAKAEDDFEDSLSKLMVGADASKVWRDIQSVDDKLADKIKDLEKTYRNADLELMSVNRRIAALSDFKPESDAVFTTLSTMVSRSGWHLPANVESEELGDWLLKAIAEFNAFLERAAEFKWAGSPVTVRKLEQFVRDSKGTTQRAAEQLEAWKENQSQTRAMSELLRGSEKKLSEILEFLEFEKAGLPELLRKLGRIEGTLLDRRRLTAGCDEASVLEYSVRYTDFAVTDFHLTAKDLRAKADAELRASQNRYSKFVALRDEITVLSQQLREIATRLVERTDVPDRCPLCHTDFAAGELQKHMKAELDLQTENIAADSIKDIRNRENDVNVAKAVERAASWLWDFSHAIGLPPTEKVGAALTRVTGIREEIVAMELSIQQLQAQLAAIEISGLTTKNYHELQSRVQRLMEPPSLNMKELSSTSDSLRNEVSARSSELRKLNEESNKINETLLTLLGTDQSKVSPVDVLLVQLNERAATAEAILGQMLYFKEQFPCNVDTPLSQIVVTGTSIRKVASDYQATLRKERAMAVDSNELSIKQKQIETQLDGLKPRIERLQEAKSVVTKIRTEYSLTGAMEKALKQNRNAIEMIFGRIHAPAEFAGLGSNLTTLVRKSSGRIASLHQVSTGQRAAFALSLFLAQNVQLRTAPPVMLIDDPIAHIDDLNCLSFLDYLREVAVSGERQIVFATANDKLATLFQRKFDFLGDSGFRRYDLSR